MKVGSKSLLVCVTILLIGFGLAWAATREPVSISGHVTAVGPTTFAGSADMTVGDDTFTGQVTVYVDPGQIEVKDGVTHYGWVMHVFEVNEEGTLTTIGEEFAVAANDDPEILTLHGNMQITQGTGTFSGASGELRVNGQMNIGVMPPEATFEAHGLVTR